MSIRRERDSRRVAKSVRTHEKTMQALGQAAGGWKRSPDNNLAYSEKPSLDEAYFYPGKTLKTVHKGENK